RRSRPAARRSGLEPQVPDLLAGRELPFSARHEHQGVGGRGADDHVRLLATDRVELRAARPGGAPRSDQLVSRRVAAERDGEPPRLVRPLRPARTLARRDRRPDEAPEADDRPHWVAPPAEAQRPPPDPAGPPL